MHIINTGKLEHVAVDKLVLHPGNPRLGDVAAIKRSIERNGFYGAVIVQKSTRHVLAGNHRLKAAIELGFKAVPVLWIDVDDLTARRILLADNKTSDLATYDETVLAALLRELNALPDGLAGTGYESTEVEALLLKAANDAAEGTNTVDPDAVPAPPDAAITQRGDIWVLGEHRLMCGDSASAADVDRLLDGRTIQLVNTDPPYNVKVEPRSNNAIAAGLSSFTATHHQKFDAERNPKSTKPTKAKLRAKDRPLANDFVSDEQFDQLLRAWFGNIARVLDAGRSFYIWGGYANCANYPPVLKACALYFSQALIWVKEHPVLTRKDFMGNHEWCFYGWNEGAGHWFNPEINNATDVWSVKKITPQKMVHLTEKPVELAVRAMTYSSRPGENVLDLFGGSGSTLIAAELMKRRAFLMELDPLYCDVIVQRWRDYTQLAPERIAA